MINLEMFGNNVMEFMVTLRSRNTFNDILYDEIYSGLEILVEDWKSKEDIPKQAFISCIYLIDFLAGGSRFYSEEVAEKAEDACNAVNELLEQLEESNGSK